MISSNVSISTEEIRKFEKYARNEILKKLQDNINKAIPYIKIALQDEIFERVQSSDVLRELRTGRLRLDLGLTKEEVSNMAEIIPDIVSKATNIRIRKTFDSIDIVAEMISRGYDDLLALPQAEYIQTYTTKEPKNIPWLSWLLTKGDTIVIGEFRVKYVGDKPYSRSGGAIMIRGGGFRVDPQFSGTESDNFITRSFTGIDNFIFQQITKYI